MATETPATTPVTRPKFRWQGEWSWEKYIPGVGGLAVLIYAILDAGSLDALLRSGLLHTALLLFIGAYLSEMRYRLFPDLRND
ncbi:MAG TPA: hypothetical protein VM557_12130 [Thermoanaerobaculia bacterium]|nr:hypothetical protein [Thermoanaerobaculia bacterium]